MFLESEWWKDLSRRKRLIKGKCEQCGCEERLQSHHVRYPANWFDTTLSDLKVLCRGCHEKEHGLVEEIRTVVHQERSSRGKQRDRRQARKLQESQERLAQGKPTWKDVCRLNSHGMLTKDVFRQWRLQLGMDPKRIKQRKESRAERREARWHPGMYEGLTKEQAFAQVGR